jgi:hypothetical protein
VVSYDIALVWWEMDEEERAFALLADALEDDPLQLERMLHDPSAEGFMEDPRFEDVLDRLGLGPTG